MIPKEDIEKAIDLAKKHGAGKLYVFGSSLHKSPENTNDYDFAISDLPPGNFFRFYGQLFMAMPKSVDLIDLTGRTDKFAKIVLSEGRLVYDKRTV